MYYIIITHTIYADKELNDGAKLTYGLILSLSQKNGLCYATNEYLAEQLNKSARTVQGHLKALKDKGYIFIKTIGNNYRLISTVDTSIVSHKDPKPLKTQISTFNKQVGANEPEWFAEYVKEIEEMEQAA